jgi:hypothetical protein
MGKRILWVLVFLILIPALSSRASDTAEQQVTFQVDQICTVALSASKASVEITAATGATRQGAFIEYSNEILTISMTSNVASRKIIASLSSDMVLNTWLYLTVVTVPAGWTSSGETLMSTSPSTLAYGGKCVGGNLSFKMRFRANALAGVVEKTTVTISLTIVDSST